jgi:hypothetical protein
MNVEEYNNNEPGIKKIHIFFDKYVITFRIIDN